MNAKKFLALLLSLTMLLGLCTVGANADANVASVTIGGTTTEYATLQEAMNAAISATGNATTTVTLLKNIEGQSSYVTAYAVAGTAPITIEGADYSISGLRQPLLRGLASKNITIQNLTIENSEIDDGEANGMGRGAFVAYIDTGAGTLTMTNCHVQDCTIDAGDYDAGALFGYSSGGDIIVNGCSVKDCTLIGGVSGAIGGYGPYGNLTVTNTTVTGNTIYGSQAYKVGVLFGYSGAVAKTYSFNATESGNKLYVGNQGSSEQLTGDAVHEIARYVSGSTIFTEGGSYTVNPTISNQYPNTSGTLGAQAGYSAFKLEDGSWTISLPVRIGNVGYATLKDAVAAAQDGATIQVFDGTYQFNYNNVIIDKNLTVQGNVDDPSAVVLKNDGAAWKAITAYGRTTPGINVTFKNLTVDAGGSSAFVSQFANLTVENVIIKNANRAFEVAAAESLTDGGYPAADGKISTITAKNVRTENTVATTVKVEALPDTGTGARSTTAVSTAIFDYDDACVFDGGLTTLVRSGVNGQCGYKNHLIKKNGALETDLLPAVAKVGETFYETLDAAAAAADAESTITVLEDMTIDSGSFPCAVVAGDDVAISIIGGTFAVDPGELVAEGYVAVKQANNTYVVSPKVELDPEASEVAVADGSSGIELTFDASTGSTMKNILDAAADSVTAVDNGDGTITTTETNVDVTVVVDEGVANTVADENHPAENVQAVYDISVQKTTTTTTTITNTSTGATLDTDVSDPVTVPVAYTGGSTMVFIPFPVRIANMIYSVYYYNGGTYENMNATYNSARGGFEFYTTHFSTYFIEGVTLDNNAVTTNFDVVLSPSGTDGKTYDILLKTTEADKFINRFTAAELTFSLTGGEGNIVYQDGITPNSGSFIKLNDSLRSANRFMFYVNGKDGTEEISDLTAKNSIKLGTITFGGYGTGWTFEITKAVVNTTTLTDNIDVISTNETAAPKQVELDNTVGTTVGSPTALIDPLTINPETKNLTLNITFPNAISDNTFEYQAMKVTVSGGDLTNDVVVELGGVNSITSVTPDVYPYSANAETTATFTPPTAYIYNQNGGATNTLTLVPYYTVTLTDILSANVLYTVEITGAGYRSTRYNVLMTGDKTLTFWNNVMDDFTIIDAAKDSSDVKVTYLAGDIVQDAQINIYDLSAVVSYFGTVNATDAASDYAKYDLNRDGKIDSIDVAYVLVSWGN